MLSAGGGWVGVGGWFLLKIKIGLSRSINRDILHSALTKENASDIERVQKNASRIIMKEKFTSYDNSLFELDMENLQQRRLTLSKKFAKNCMTNAKTAFLFEKTNKKHIMLTRKSENIKVIHAKN